MAFFRLRPEVTPPKEHPWLIHGPCYEGFVHPDPSRPDGTEQIIIVHPTEPHRRTEPLGYELFKPLDSEDDCPDWDLLMGYVGPELPG